MNGDIEVLTSLNHAELRALAESRLASESQARLEELLADNQESKLDAREKAELDELLSRVDQLNILKARAKLTLTQQDDLGES